MDRIWLDPTFLTVFFVIIGVATALSYWAIKQFGNERVEKWSHRLLLTTMAMDIVTGNTRIHWPVAKMIYTMKSTSAGTPTLIALSLTAAFVGIKRFGYQQVENFLYALLIMPYSIDKLFLIRQKSSGQDSYICTF